MSAHVSINAQSAPRLTALAGTNEPVGEVLLAALEMQQRAADELAQLEALKASFLRAISHALRTPLTGVVGFAHVLAARNEQLGSEELASLCGKLLASAGQLERIVEDVFDVERASQGKIRLELTDVDVGRVVRALAERIDPEGRRIRTNEREAAATVDRAKVERMVEHLILNAFDHTPPGTMVDVWVRGAAQWLDVVVEDEGPGVPYSMRRTIFEPFRQGPDAADHPFPGAGIGLTLVARFADLHGGRAWAESRPGGGARFTVRLPRRRSPDEPAA
jgi:signal transduction histidine kinase